MLYFLTQTIMASTEKAEEFKKVFPEVYLPIPTKYGQRLVGSWQSWLGEIPIQLTHMWAFDDAEAMIKSRAARYGDEDLVKARAAVRPFMASETKQILVPLPYSPLQ